VVLMERYKSILLIGPFPSPITGNSLSNTTLFQGLNKKGVSVKYLNTSTKFSENLGRFSFSKLFSFLKMYVFIYRVFFSSVIYITPGQTFLGVIKYSPFIVISKLLGKKIVIHVHGNFIHQEYEKLSGIKKKVYYFVLSLANQGIVLSSMLRKNLDPFLDDDNVHEVFNFVENSILESHPVKKFHELRIIYLSNLMTEKGIFELLNALLILKKKGIAYRARIAGNIPPNLKEKVGVKLQAILETTEYLGVVKGEAKVRLLEWGNTFVLPTYYLTEGQPISILEAMAAGNIVLTTDQGGIPDIFSKKNGYFIEKRSSKDIADKLTELNMLDQVAMMSFSNTNMEYAKKFTEEKFVENVLKVINVVC
jgi:glycosyltransferase involved in cell wall biosynthesis